jgi:hypothetical protein
VAMKRILGAVLVLVLVCTLVLPVREVARADGTITSPPAYGLVAGAYYTIHSLSHTGSGFLGDTSVYLTIDGAAPSVQFFETEWDPEVEIGFRGTNMPCWDGDMHAVVIHAHGSSGYGTYSWHWSGSIAFNWADGALTTVEALSVTVSGDATPYVDESVQFTHTVTGGIDSHYGYWEVYNSVGGLEYGGAQVANGTALTYSFGHAGYHDVTYTAIDSDNSTAHGHFMTTAYEDALECLISGAVQWGVGVVSSWTITGSHGVVHTGDVYDYRLGVQYGIDAVEWGAWGSSGSIEYTFDVSGGYRMYGEVRDSHGTVAQDTADVVVGATVANGAFRWTACRRGVYGEYIDVVLYEITAGGDSQVLGSAWSMGTVRIAQRGAGGAWTSWDVTENTLSPGGGGRTFIQPQAFMFEVTLTHDAIAIPIVGEFYGTTGCTSGWNGEDGTPINPLEFPVDDATAWDWLKPLIDQFIKMFNYLFVPTVEDMRRLLPLGTLGASLIAHTSWGTPATEWDMHVHYANQEVQIVHVVFADLESFSGKVKMAVQIGYVLALIYLVVVLI